MIPLKLKAPWADDTSSSVNTADMKSTHQKKEKNYINLNQRKFMLNQCFVSRTRKQKARSIMKLNNNFRELLLTHTNHGFNFFPSK